ncbi:MAG: hypothetical protein JWN34_5732, partial [Bryobacterales bacterium]|nr:hypothetical protein [Bryobacterales bacterium]
MPTRGTKPFTPDTVLWLRSTYGRRIGPTGLSKIRDAEKEIMSTITEHERTQIQRANESGHQPVVFVHGLWLLSSSWDRWCNLFEDRGYATIAPGWPDDPESVEAARKNPEVFAHKMVRQVTDHYLEAISLLDLPAAVVGHSFGGLVAQKIAGEGASVATVAIDPAPFKGVLPLPLS